MFQIIVNQVTNRAKGDKWISEFLEYPFEIHHLEPFRIVAVYHLRWFGNMVTVNSVGYS